MATALQGVHRFKFMGVSNWNCLSVSSMTFKAIFVISGHGRHPKMTIKEQKYNHKCSNPSFEILTIWTIIITHRYPRSTKFQKLYPQNHH